MARPKKNIDPEHDFSLQPKIGPSCGAPWNLVSASGALLAYCPSYEAAGVTAQAMWGDISMIDEQGSFSLFQGKKLLGRVVRGKRTKPAPAEPEE